MHSNHQNLQSEKELIEQTKRFVSAGYLEKAISFCQSEVNKNPKLVSLAILLTQLYQQNTQFDKMLSQIKKMSEASSGKNILIEIRKSECLIYASEIKQAIDTLDEIYQQSQSHENVLTKLAELYIHCAQHQKVAMCHNRCLELSPKSASNLYNVSFSQLTLGKLNKASKLIDQVLAKNNADFDAYYSRSIISKKNLDNNNLDELKELFNKSQGIPQAVVALGYSIGKESEDVGEYQQAFHYIDIAAKKRRQGLRYQVENDVKAIDKIIETSTQQNFSQGIKSTSNESPIFVVGLPRSGTTLVEQILNSHSHVGSLGEINSFAFAMMHTVGPNKDKLDLIEKSSSCNFDKLASRYFNATQGYGVKGEMLIDKTPLNFLYIGLIKNAFPNAKIIHLRRHPLDSCFAMYKTLFRMGYPFSYSLDDLAEYYIAYHRLMDHWRHLYGDSVYDLSYQSLVDEPEQQARTLLNYCKLEWQPEVLSFYENKAPSATASAAQVRQPIYKTSVNRWAHYSEQLKGLQNKLKKAGINCD